MAQGRKDRETQLFIDQATQIADKLKIKKILVVCEGLSLWNALQPSYAKNQFIVVVPGKRLSESISVETFLCDFSGVARSDRLDFILRSALESVKLVKGERVLCMYSLAGIKLLDTLRIVKVEEHFSPIAPRDLKRIGKNVPVDVLFQLINLAIEIGQEGREGVPVGTIFVVGDTEKVLTLSKPLIFNPFRGYPEEQCNIFDPKVVESIKELAVLDGAFVMRDDGVVDSAGRFLHAGAGKTTPFKGLGARHAAAAAISQHSNAVAIVVSESTGTVRVYSGGNAVRSVRPYRPQIRRHK